MTATRLRGEGLVQLDEVELVDGDAGAREQLADRGTGPIPITAGSTPATAEPRKVAEGLDPELARPLGARDDERRGAVVDPARVARRHRAVLRGTPA